MVDFQYHNLNFRVDNQLAKHCRVWTTDVKSTIGKCLNRQFTNCGGLQLTNAFYGLEKNLVAFLSQD